MMTTEIKNEIIKRMEQNPVVIDDHNNQPAEITGLVEFVNDEKDLACCFDSRYYSLNPCKLRTDTGELHCSMYSIGGVLMGPYPNEEDLKRYNDSCVLNSFKIKCIHRPDGTKVYPAA